MKIRNIIAGLVVATAVIFPTTSRADSMDAAREAYWCGGYFIAAYGTIDAEHATFHGMSTDDIAKLSAELMKFAIRFLPVNDRTEPEIAKILDYGQMQFKQSTVAERDRDMKKCVLMALGLM